MPLFRRAHVVSCLTVLIIVVAAYAPVFAQSAQPAQATEPAHTGGEVDLVVPPLTGPTFLNGIQGPTLLKVGLIISLLEWCSVL
jgi:hypothetical protein